MEDIATVKRSVESSGKGRGALAAHGGGESISGGSGRIVDSGASMPKPLFGSKGTVLEKKRHCFRAKKVKKKRQDRHSLIKRSV